MVFVYIFAFQTVQKCAEVGTNDGHGHVVCQVGDDPDDLTDCPGTLINFIALLEECRGGRSAQIF